MQLYLNLFQHLSFHNQFHLVHSEAHNEASMCTSNVTRSTKLRVMQCCPELAIRSTEFRVPENLIFPALIFKHYKNISYK